MTDSKEDGLDAAGLKAARDTASALLVQPDFADDIVSAYLSASSPPVGGSGETQEYTLRAMAENYGDGPHVWDHLDAEACRKAADEIRALRAAPVALVAPVPNGVPEGATHRHKKRGSEYVLIGFGRMQSGNWHQTERRHDTTIGSWLVVGQPADMREVAIYRSVDDGWLWVRPREEFEDGRFEVIV